MPETIQHGDRVRFTSARSRTSLVAAYYEGVYLVVKVLPDHMLIDTHLPFICDPLRVDREEVVKTDQPPWWEEAR